MEASQGFHGLGVPARQIDDPKKYMRSFFRAVYFQDRYFSLLDFPEVWYLQQQCHGNGSAWLKALAWL